MTDLIILLFKIQFFQGQSWTAGIGWTVPTGYITNLLYI